MTVKTRTLKQKRLIPATPKAVYEALATTKGHRAVTGAPASISPKVGGKITAHDGWVTGINLTLVPGKRIVQEWRAGDWPEGHSSTVTFALKAAKGGTELSFLQTGIPAKSYDEMKAGWVEFYWQPLVAYFKKKG